jgi:hypothetical protein
MAATAWVIQLSATAQAPDSLRTKILGSTANEVAGTMSVNSSGNNMAGAALTMASNGSTNDIALAGPRHPRAGIAADRRAEELAALHRATMDPSR